MYIQSFIVNPKNDDELGKLGGPQGWFPQGPPVYVDEGVETPSCPVELTYVVDPLAWYRVPPINFLLNEGISKHRQYNHCEYDQKEDYTKYYYPVCSEPV